ncbi:hypothetical protein BKA70DRAFT_1307286 [Coprinopsis sp. MPI-PUGE-AT-0042]|nr:hypothetical protein BKA70DRAFT_1307286 [Coprinopsis sp. MPI-PUGE-AT-0042]
MCSQVSSTCANPLDPYLTSNDPLPETLYPALDEHLSHLSQAIDHVDERIAELQRALFGAQNERAGLIDTQKRHSATRSAIRRTPLELIGVIFGHILEDSPFGKAERTAFHRLGTVCTAWRMAAKTTTGLCPGFVIDFDELLAQEGNIFSEGLCPWLELPGDMAQFELVLSEVRSSYPEINLEPYFDALNIHFSKVGRLALNSGYAVSSFLKWSNGQHVYPHISLLTLGAKDYEFDVQTGDLTQLNAAFPSLDTLYIRGYVSLQPLPAHTHLRSLALEAMAPAFTAVQLRSFLAGLPLLENLLLTHPHEILKEVPEVTSGPLLDHQRLRQVMLIGEGLLEKFRFVTLPSLQRLQLKCRRMFLPDDINRSTSTMQHLLKSSHSQQLDISITGDVSNLFLSTLLRVLSPRFRLHLGFTMIVYTYGTSDTDRWYASARGGPLFDTHKVSICSPQLKEIICTADTGSLWWLDGGIQRGDPVDIHIPTNVLGRREISEERLLEWGFNLQIHSDAEAESMFCRVDCFEKYMTDWGDY